jgi:stage V sporulation protein G
VHTLPITEVRMEVINAESDPDSFEVAAYCSVTIADAFVIRDVRLMHARGKLGVSMPARKIADHCPSCSTKNHLRANFCNRCGAKLDPFRNPPRYHRDTEITTRDGLHADIAHPINQGMRDTINQAVIAAFHHEIGQTQEARRCFS